ncbi:hypothetical protein Agub_g4653 [Astrephomene gubernaculifera]|uniref:Uncharacterized protein n=1 Tax=Astrephomene gubernaculifera TaxID=47775 RepID=A0AAD3DKH8_9CHLO|nr:hypothetical protein Agub_g4653 [Astrephomene gubernaculifera]
MGTFGLFQPPTAPSICTTSRSGRGSHVWGIIRTGSRRDRLVVHQPMLHGVPNLCSCKRGCAAAAPEWSYGGYQAAPEWSVGSGPYADPRATAAGPRRHHPQQGGAPEGPSTSYDQDGDPLSEIVRTAVDAVNGGLGFVVAMLSDTALSLLPAHVKRRAVENSVKGALALLGLALLQSVLALVLTVGTLVLAVYAANQVFGVHLPFLPASVAGRGAAQTAPPFSGPGQADPRQFGQGGYSGYGDVGGFSAGPAADPRGYRQGYPPGYGGRGQPYPPRPGAGRGARAGDARQGPTIDVYFESQ